MLRMGPGELTAGGALPGVQNPSPQHTVQPSAELQLLFQSRAHPWVVTGGRRKDPGEAGSRHPFREGMYLS